MVYIHTALGLGALVSGLGIVLMPKGSAKHKNVGRLYVVTMYLLCLTSFSLQRVFGSLGFFHVFSILSIVNITIGLLPLLFKKRWPLWYVYHHTLMLYSFVGLIMALNSHFAQYIEMNEILERVLLWGTPYLVGSVFIIRRHIYLVNRLSSKKIVG